MSLPVFKQIQKLFFKKKKEKKNEWDQVDSFLQDIIP
jgi:hypothetical protein